VWQILTNPDDEKQEMLVGERLKIALYIYIGQNIRDSGILLRDSYLMETDSVVKQLLENGIVERSRFYSFDVLRVSYKYMMPLKEIVERKLQERKEKICSALASIPKVVLSFLVFDYLVDELSFPVEKDQLFDWKGILLENRSIKNYKKSLFETLEQHEFCIKTRNYVSTRGGEPRKLDYVITAEVRKFLEEVTSRIQFPNSLKDLVTIYWLIHGQADYGVNKKIEITIKDDTLSEFGSDPDSIRKALGSLLTRLNSADALEEVKRIPGFGWVLGADRKAILGFLEKDVQSQVVEPWLSEKIMISQEPVIKEANFLSLVNNLIDRKFSVYKIAAQFEGKGIFESLPSIEKCIIELATPLPGEEGLRKFIGDLHQALEESSSKEILKFREVGFPTFEQWLGIKEMPSEASSFYEDAKSFFQDLNKLRNFYSHSADAKSIFETGLIFSKLIGKYSPDREDVRKTQALLLEKSVRALDNLRRALEVVWQKMSNPC
jgi:hypothetical protein